MCGVAGVIALSGPPPSRDEITRMCDAMSHRGPDDAGYLVEGPVAFGMRRLAIIDVSGGHQPIFNEDGTVGTVFNGEIYNYRDLRKSLEGKGHRFSTNSDTEVIVHLYEEVGVDFPKHLNGMFAIALFDRARRKIVLARDHVGIKPLYYAYDGKNLVFGSEVKVLLASNRVPRRLDVDALGQFLSWEYVPGAATLLRDIRRLSPASTCEMDLATGSISIVEYWDPLRSRAKADASTSAAEYEDELDATIRRCVRNQMVSDVPIGAFLSGGVDSSLVVAAMGHAETFSIGFDDPTYNETAWSAKVAQHLGVRHHIEVIKPRALELFEHLMHFMDDPIGDFSIFPTYLVSKLARQHVTVALSGDGGDELFGGYETYLAEEKARTWARIPRVLRAGAIEPFVAALPPSSAKKGLVNKAKRFVEGARLDARLGHARWRVFVEHTMRRRLFTASAHAQMLTSIEDHILTLRERARNEEPGNRTLYTDFRSYLVDNCLTKVDRMSMACSLEARVPLLDLDVVDLAFRMPSALKFNGSETKIALKRVAARHVPRDCIYRPKEGFSIPIKNWLKEEFRQMMTEQLSVSTLQRDGLFQSDVVATLQQEHLSNRANHSHILWALLVFQQWKERWNVAL
jgi:asparagine synthase (glutamine-hydrolysing)